MTETKRAWLYLVAAAGMETCWFYSILWMQKLTWDNGLNLPQGPLEGWIGLAGYAGFGIANAVLFLKAAKGIRVTIAFSVWTGIALLLLVLVDHFAGLQPLNALKSLCLFLILMGVWGLKKEG
jgi:multidrug transporter EmrE-like cation transporter